MLFWNLITSGSNKARPKKKATTTLDEDYIREVFDCMERRVPFIPFYVSHDYFQSPSKKESKIKKAIELLKSEGYTITKEY